MKNILFTVVAVASMASCSDSSKKEVHLKGQLENYSPLEMKYEGISSLVGKSRNILISVDENGYFDTIISIEKPEYYSILRNTLYLTPGDDMEIYISSDNSEARFSGKGAEANNYLKKLPIPYLGSFLESGKNVKDDFESTKSTVDSLAAIRYAELENLADVSKTFKELEKARITADKINSYRYYRNYGKELKTLSSEEEKYDFRNKIADKLTAYVNPLYKEITDDRYLELVVVRGLMSTDMRERYANWFENVPQTEFNKKLYRAAKYANNLDDNPSPEYLDEITSALPELSDASIVHELKLKIEKAKTLQPGQPAFDFTFSDTSDNVKRLSDFKGKVVYIDFWATWCGPCIQESPYYEALAEKFTDKDIVFLPVCTFDVPQDWLKYLEKHEKKLVQYYTSDNDLQDNWNISFIPRFVIIDKEQKIIKAYAPPPSDPATEELLNSLL